MVQATVHVRGGVTMDALAAAVPVVADGSGQVQPNLDLLAGSKAECKRAIEAIGRVVQVGS